MSTLAENISAAIVAAEEHALVARMESLYGRGTAGYRGWTFAWEYPGSGCFVRACGGYGVIVWATPDWEWFGSITVCITTESGDGFRRSDPRSRDAATLPFWGERTEAWFAAAKPYLDKYTPPYQDDVELVQWIRESCANELRSDPAFPFFHMNHHDGESPDDALLRLFREERANHSTDRDAVLALCHG